MQVIITKTEIVKRSQQFPWEMTVGDDDQYCGDGIDIIGCISFGHHGQEEADHGVMWFRRCDTECLEMHFEVK